MEAARPIFDPGFGCRVRRLERAETCHEQRSSDVGERRGFQSARAIEMQSARNELDRLLVGCARGVDERNIVLLLGPGGEDPHAREVAGTGLREPQRLELAFLLEEPR